MKTNPPHVPTCTGMSGHSPSTCGKSHLHGMCLSDPSRSQVMPWKGHWNESARPSCSFRVRPRWRQMLRWALIDPSRCRTTSTDTSAMSYFTYCPGSRMSSTRQATCQTFFQTRSTSRSWNSREV